MFLAFQRAIYVMHPINLPQIAIALAFLTFICTITMLLSAPKVTTLPNKPFLNYIPNTP